MNVVFEKNCRGISNEVDHHQGRGVSMLEWRTTLAIRFNS